MSTKDVATIVSILVIAILSITIIWLVTFRWDQKIKESFKNFRTLVVSEEVINDNQIQPGPAIASPVVKVNDTYVASNVNNANDRSTSEVIVRPVPYVDPIVTIDAEELDNREVIVMSDQDQDFKVGSEVNVEVETDLVEMIKEPIGPFEIDPEAILRFHNVVRAHVSVEPLTWSGELADQASMYATNLASECQLVHDKSIKECENLFYGWYLPRPDDFDSIIPSISWGQEKDFYNYDKNSCEKGEVCGHYTQMVWSDTKEIGCGQAICQRSDEESIELI